MYFRMISGFVLLLVVLSTSSGGDVEREFDAGDHTDAQVLAMIRGAVQPGDPQAAERGFVRLKRSLIERELSWRVRLGRQLLLLRAVPGYAMGQGMTPRSVMGAWVLLPELFESEQVVLRLTLPFLDSDDRRVRSAASNLLFTRVEQTSVDGHFDLSAHLSYLDEHGEEASQAVVRRAYQLSPGEMLRAMGHVNGLEQKNRRILSEQRYAIEAVLWRYRWDKEVDVDGVAAAQSATEELAADDRWWVRYYVAVIGRRHPELVGEQVRQRLLKDENEAVAEAIEAPFDPVLESLVE